MLKEVCLQSIPHRERELKYFLLLEPEQQRQAIQRLAATGMSDSTIASATSLSVEMVRRILGDKAAAG
jgi:DNA invertase Pin-like site-specific DNA recombinase